VGVTVSAASHEDFLSRLDRIRASAGQTVVMVGQDEQHVLTRRVIVRQSRGREVAGNLAYPASLLGAILLGMVAVAVSQYVRFQLTAGSPQLPDDGTGMLMVGGIGIAASFVLSQAFRLTSKEHRSLQGIGVFLMVCTFHNFSHWLPGPMSAAFSPDYVMTTADASLPNSIRFGATYYPLHSADAAPDETLGPAETANLNAAPTTEAPDAEPRKLPVVRKAGKIVQGG
jgi:hypothetical protein